jgi:ribosome-binding ATPase YchF (GTP1/OBG family)
MERSRKTVHAQVGFVDVPGGTSSSQGIAKLREADALAIVVRCFGPDAEPVSEVAEVRADLLLADQAVIEPAATRSSYEITSARMKPRSRSEWITPAASGAFAPLRTSHARVSSSPVVRNVIRSIAR